MSYSNYCICVPVRPPAFERSIPEWLTVITIPYGARPASMGFLARAAVVVRRTRRYGTEQDAVDQATMNETAEPDIRATPREKT